MRRTQIYLDEEQHRLVERRARDAGVTRSEIIRRAINAFVGRKRSRADVKRALDETFGSIPHLKVPPRSEWDRGYG